MPMLGRFGANADQQTVAPKGFDDYEMRLGDSMRGERATMGKSLLDVERDLRIKAAHLAAIENCDLAAFEAPSFIAGYVRSYARYLGLNPDASFAQFCSEAGFVPAHGLSPAASTAAVVAVRAKSVAAGGEGTLFYPSAIAAPRGLFGRMEPGALGSVAVLLAVALGLGYGGWSVLREVQKVQLAPIEAAPAIVADVPAALAQPAAPASASAAAQAAAGVPLGATDLVAGANAAPILPVLSGSGSEDLAARSAQPDALDVPILIARDGPISAIDPRDTGILATAVPEETVQVVAAPQMVSVLAVRPSWISITAADGTVLFEKILDAGERYAVPQLEVAPRLKAGNSSAIYFVLGDKTFGPASTGPEVVRNVDLAANAVQSAFGPADPAKDADLTSFMVENTQAIAPAASGAPAP